jgi:hypothetical protein
VAGKRIEMASQRFEMAVRRFEVVGKRIELASRCYELVGKRIEVAGKPIEVAGKPILVAGRRIELAAQRIEGASQRFKRVSRCSKRAGSCSKQAFQRSMRSKSRSLRRLHEAAIMCALVCEVRGGSVYLTHVSFTLKLHGVIVGRSDLEERDPEARTASGAFRKGAGYGLVEPIFDLRSAGADEKRYRKARDILALALYDEAGVLLDTSAIDLEPSAQPDRLMLRATIVDPRFWATA